MELDSRGRGLRSQAGLCVIAKGLGYTAFFTEWLVATHVQEQVLVDCSLDCRFTKQAGRLLAGRLRGRFEPPVMRALIMRCPCIPMSPRPLFSASVVRVRKKNANYRQLAVAL